MKYGSITGTGGRLDTKVRINEKGSEGERFHTISRKTLSLKKKNKNKKTKTKTKTKKKKHKSCSMFALLTQPSHNELPSYSC